MKTQYIYNKDFLKRERLESLKQFKLFEGITENELLNALKCLNAELKVFKSGSTIYSEGAKATKILILLYGQVQLIKHDLEGNTNIISNIFPPDIIALSASFSSYLKIPADIVAASDCEILFLETKKLLSVCESACVFHNRIIKNAVDILADKNIQLTQKIDILSKRSIREKLFAFLLSQTKQSDSNVFYVGLSRTQLADYLSVDRCAMIRELSKMREENIIDFDKNTFTIKKLS